ncbi:MAG: tRNA (N(6)-L-threonylcarbamoyladenosine(37)-C(2))-methylthiotransferase [Candidatus Bathyarchaeia archaeon]|nr:tRNA (N(6)-L-threonylcarbamoyladenosine(37)-C(2))-methylthiotransferase [Candidatus Bathyarchaeota archaeon A05DMB-4]MDH7595259.1 tRNA (N(6)-L-threonylcarbamoyladenosine(37)-C(2))-methylthiotransferase [Candidatus Bathyarchaeota archaeon]
MKVFVQGFGCSSSIADAEVMAGCLRDAGFELVDCVEEADVVVYNTCGVKMPTENKMFHLLKAVPAEKRLVVAGCLPLINYPRLMRDARFDAVVGPAFGDRIVEVVKRVLNDEKVVFLNDSLRSKPRLNLPRARVNSIIGITPVAYGCVGECSYCCVKFARGALRSFRIDEIADYVEKSLKAGVKEFWFTGQDVAYYGQDIGVDFVDLLKHVCNVDAKENFWIRVGMMTPNGLKPFLESFTSFLSSPEGKSHVFKFFHVPVQSGDDEVLKLMNRKYTIDDFRRVISTLKQTFPQATIATDVIVGFPGESEEAFEHTIQLVEKVKPDIVNVSKFFARPNTPAERMEKKVDVAEIKRRSEEMAKIVRQIALQKNKAWVGWSGSVLIDEKGKNPNSWIGRNFAYKPIVIQCEDNLLGKTLNVHVVDAFQSHLKGEIV